MTSWAHYHPRLSPGRRPGPVRPASGTLGTAFQMEVWEVARRRNLIAVVIRCHGIVDHEGSLGGDGDGVHRKR